MGSDGQHCEVMVRGLPPMWSEDEVEALFAYGRPSSHEGEIARIERSDSSSINDRATLVFNSTRNAQLAVEELNGLDLGDDGGGVLHCEIKAAHPKPLPRPTRAPHLVSASQPTVKSSAKLGDAKDTVQLRGLPFRAGVADIKAFLGKHAEDLASDGEPAIRLLLNRDGRPSGFARVRFISADAAEGCCTSLHLQEMGDRYVEVLPCSEFKGKSRQSRTEMKSEGLLEGISSTLDDEFANEQVLQDIRNYFSQSGQEPVLLSMLGLALSTVARSHLRSVGLGVKHFLARYPAEFLVEGAKGSEYVAWTPGETIPGSDDDDHGDDLPLGDFQIAPSVETRGRAHDPYRYQPGPSAPMKRSHAHLDPAIHPGTEAGKELPMVRLRGLPFSMIAQEVLDFFAEHGVGDYVADGVEAVKMLTKANGRPSGQAVVQIRSHDDADHVQQTLNKQFVGDRYVEVFAYGDEGVGAEIPQANRKRKRFR